MSGQEFQSKNFLARWSRRKHEAKAGDAAPEPDKLVEADDLTPPGDISEKRIRWGKRSPFVFRGEPRSCTM